VRALAVKYLPTFRFCSCCASLPAAFPATPATCRTTRTNCCKLNVTAPKTRTPCRPGVLEKGAWQLNCAKKAVNNGSKTQTTHEQWMANEIEFGWDYIWFSFISKRSIALLANKCF